MELGVSEFVKAMKYATTTANTTTTITTTNNNKKKKHRNVCMFVYTAGI